VRFPVPAAKSHSALVTRKSQLLDMINQEKNRIKQTWDDDAKQSIRETLEILKSSQKMSMIRL
jgi:hypothetical protein